MWSDVQYHVGLSVINAYEWAHPDIIIKCTYLNWWHQMNCRSCQFFPYNKLSNMQKKHNVQPDLPSLSYIIGFVPFATPHIFSRMVVLPALALPMTRIRKCGHMYCSLSILTCVSSDVPDIYQSDNGNAKTSYWITQWKPTGSVCHYSIDYLMMECASVLLRRKYVREKGVLLECLIKCLPKIESGSTKKAMDNYPNYWSACWHKCNVSLYGSTYQYVRQS